MLAATALATIALAAGGEPPFSGSPQTARVDGSFTASVTQSGTQETLFWAEPDRVAVKPSQRGVGRTVERGGVRTVGRGRGFPGSRIAGTFPARPDGFSETFRIPSNEYSLARARSGRKTFTPSRAGRRAALRTSFRLAANECAGLEAGRGELWLNRWTLMPLRYIERRGGRVLKTTIGYSRRNQAHPAGTFKHPRIGARAFKDSQGFMRTAPGEAAAELSYAPLLPTVLPKGFELAISGWAPESGFTGPEASNPVYPELFAAVYRKGYERIDVTQRRSTEEWPSDPFGAECGFLFTSRATVNGNDAMFGTGPGFVPHLYWSDGELLHTLSGPYPKADLITIAESLAPVSVD